MSDSISSGFDMPEKKLVRLSTKLFVVAAVLLTIFLAALIYEYSVKMTDSVQAVVIAVGLIAYFSGSIIGFFGVVALSTERGKQRRNGGG